MAGPPSFAIESDVHAGTARVRVTGELDIDTAELLDRELLAILTGAVDHLIIDLRPLAFIDSSALRLLIELNDRAAGEDWQLSLLAPSGPALKIFQITGAEEHLPFIDDEGR